MVRVGLKDDESGERLDIFTIYETHSTRLVILEPDPESHEKLFVIDEEQRVIHILDSG